MKLLKDVASTNSTVLCTIHQPSSEVFMNFDMCIFLLEGQILYQGPVEHLTSHFSRFDFHWHKPTVALRCENLARGHC